MRLCPQLKTSSSSSSAIDSRAGQIFTQDDSEDVDGPTCLDREEERGGGGAGS